MPLMLLGGIGLMLLLVGKQRALVAYSIQSAMPLYKEGIDEMSLSISKVAEKITKGVEKAKNDNK